MKLFTTVVILVAFAFGGLAVAQATCGMHARMIVTLNMSYGEARLGVGSGRTTLFEIWTNAETGSWTILEVFASGKACVRAVGNDWKTNAPVVPGDPA